MLQSPRTAKKVKFGSKKICIAEIATETLKTQLLVFTRVLKKSYPNLVGFNYFRFQNQSLELVSRVIVINVVSGGFRVEVFK